MPVLTNNAAMSPARETPIARSGGPQLPPAPWQDAQVETLLAHLGDRWLRSDGVLATCFDGSHCVDPTPLVADLGDTAPFIYALGQPSQALQQAELVEAHLDRSLFSQHGTIELFDNHDYLLGLTHLYEVSGQQKLLTAIDRALDTLERDFEVEGLLVDQRPCSRWAALDAANPFNGGFIEVCVDLFRCTEDPRYLRLARRWAEAWLRTPYFRIHGLFARRNMPRAPLIGLGLDLLSHHGPVRLFKDNTNLVWSLLALYRVSHSERLYTALCRFVAAFSRRLYRYGVVAQFSGGRAARPTYNLKASSSALDLLCDLCHFGIASDHCLALARGIASDCLDRQWKNGLFPLDSIGEVDHVDLNTDLGIALWKLWELTHDCRFRDGAIRAWTAQWKHHFSADGLIQAVGQNGQAMDSRVMVKYQALALKPVLLWRSGDRIYENTALWSLLRDR